MIRRARLATLPRKPALLVLDFDGVLTDNHVYVDQDGREMVRCSREDSLGISLLQAAGVPVIVISKERNPVVSARCAKMKVACIQACDEKRAALVDVARERAAALRDIVYVGNDVNDIECLEAVGCGLVPSDAHPRACAAAKAALSRRGGEGAVREACDLILERIGAPGGVRAARKARRA